jgi:hypothetical protein
MHPASVCARLLGTWESQRERYSHEQNAKDGREKFKTQRHSQRADSAPAVSPVQAVAMSIRQRGERHIERMAGVSERGVDHIETMDGPEILDSVDEIEKLDKVARRTFSLSDSDSHGNNAVVNIALLGIDPESVRVDQRDS